MRATTNAPRISAQVGKSDVRLGDRLASFLSVPRAIVALTQGFETAASSRSPALVIAEYAARKDPDGDHDGDEDEELADDGVELVGKQRFALADQEAAGRDAEEI